MSLVTPSLSISGKDIDKYKNDRSQTNLVYVWKREGVNLYIGVSRIGFTRPFGKSHHIINKLDQIRDTDTFDFYFFDEFDRAAALERVLTVMDHSRYNSCNNTGYRNRYISPSLRIRKNETKKQRAIRKRVELIRVNAPRMLSLIEANSRFKSQVK